MNTKPLHSEHIQIGQLGISQDGDRFLRLTIRLGQRRRRELLSLRELEASPDQAVRALGAALITNATRAEFLKRAQDAFKMQGPAFHVVTRPGFSRGAFVYPDGTHVPERVGFDVCLRGDALARAGKYETCGTLEGWRELARLARGNPLLVLAISLAFSGPVVDFLKLEAVMMQLFGPSGAGKSVIGAVAGSVWGGGADGLFVESWNHTVNDLELLVAARRAAFVVLDETRVADQPQSGRSARSASIASAVMRLAEGRVKGRMNEAVFAPGASPSILSLSNNSLDEMAADLGFVIDEAHRGRLIDVPLPTGVVGAFENLHGYLNHAELCGELLRLLRLSNGVAAAEFLMRLTKPLSRDERRVIAALRSRRDRYLQRARRQIAAASRDLERVHQKFATAFAGADVAREFGILPWERELLEGALIECEAAHVEYVARVAPTTARRERAADPFDLLAAHDRARRASFVDLRAGLVDPGSDHDHAACDGYVNQGRGGLELLFSQPKLQQICGGKAASLRVKRQLDAQGWLVRDGARLCTRRVIWADGRREQVVAVRAEAFSRRGGAAA